MLRIIAVPNPYFTGERYGVFFREGRAEVDSADPRYRLLLQDLGYRDVTPEPEPRAAPSRAKDPEGA